MKIVALPKEVFDHNFNSEIIEKHDNACFISILDPDNYDDNKFKDTFLDNFLQVKMWDIEKDLFNEKGELLYEKPSSDVLQKIFEFIEKHSDKKVFVVHCSAGISRSGAVVEYIKERFHEEFNKEQYMRDNKYILPNLYILKELRERHYKTKK